MAFQKDKTTSANAAVMTTGVIVSALINQQDGSVSTTAKLTGTIEKVFEALNAPLGAIVDADNKLFLENADAPAAKSSGGNRSSSKSSGGAKGEKKFTLDEAMELELNSGKFKGVTLGDVYNMDEDEAAEYNHREGEAGKTYVKWLTTSANPNDYTRAAAKAIIAGKKASSDDDE